MSLDEAQMLLPVLRSLVARAQGEAANAGTLEAGMQALQQRIFLTGGMHVDVAAVARRRAERDKAVAATRSTLEEIEQVGARVSDLSEGALEIPCRAEGRDVLLCWAAAEPAIERWREDTEGAPEQPLTEGPFRPDRLH